MQADDGDWLGEYYDNSWLMGPPALVRVDDAIEFDRDDGAPEESHKSRLVSEAGGCIIPRNCRDPRPSGRSEVNLSQCCQVAAADGKSKGCCF